MRFAVPRFFQGGLGKVGFKINVSCDFCGFSFPIPWMGFEEICGISIVEGLEERVCRIANKGARAPGKGARSAGISFKTLGADSGAEKSGISTLKRGAPKPCACEISERTGLSVLYPRHMIKLCYGL
jgi:hypothetical protein